MAIPPFDKNGDLPLGVHPATLREVLDRFETGNPQRKAVGLRLERIYHLAMATGGVSRFIVFGSFVSDVADPNDVDVFILMDDAFDASQLKGEVQLLFDHPLAQTHFGASVFWLRRLAALDGEQATVEYWQTKRGGQKRGVIEIIREQS